MAHTLLLYGISTKGLLIGVSAIVFVAWIMKIVRIQMQKRKRLVELAAKLPGPKGLPLIGSALQFACKPDLLLDRFMQLAVPYQDVTPISIWLGPMLLVVVTEPRDIEVILNSQKATRKGSVYRLLRPFIGQGLVSGSDHTWRSYRKSIAPMFNARTLERFSDVVQKHSKILIEKLKPLANGAEFDVGPYLTTCTVDAVCETIMGHPEMNSQESLGQDFIHAGDSMYEVIHNRMLKIWLHPDWIFRLSSGYREQQRSQRVLHNFTEKVISQKRKELAESPNGESGTDDRNRNSILEQLIRRIESGENNLNVADLRDQIYTVYVAAQDTMALISSFSLLMLAIHTDVQDRVRSELDEVLLDDTENIPPGSLPEFKYLEMVIKETLRLYPIAPFMIRSMKGDLALDTCELPEGCEVLVAIYLTHKNPRHWKNPEKFIPERFTSEEIARRHPYAYAPFSGGLMGCIGQKFAVNSLKMIVANVLRCYRITTTVRMEDIKLKKDISIRSVNGFKMTLKLLRP